jgi:lipid-binding SYLF domain-containing protein
MLSIGMVAVALFAALMLRTLGADPYSDTVALFRSAGPSASYFDSCYGYAVFPTVGKGGLVVGGARGNGRVYEQGVYVGDTSLTQASVSFKAGGQAYSQIVFFQDVRALSEFTSGSFEFGADVGDASTAATYHQGLAVFAIAKGGTMYEAPVAGQKFSYQPPSAE